VSPQGSLPGVTMEKSHPTEMAAVAAALVDPRHDAGSVSREMEPASRCHTIDRINDKETAC
jgi:hypothetical protein